MSLLPERLLKTLDVNRMPMFRSDHLREIQRKAVRVVEFEGVFTGDDRLMPQLLHPHEATLDRLEKPLLFRARHALDVRLLRDDGLKEVGVEIRGDILHDRRDPLQAGTGVYGRSREHGAPTVRLLIVLHEDEVPDLQELSRFTDAQELFEAQVAAPCSPLRAPDVDQDLRTGTARSRIAHLPEVVLVAQAKDAAVSDPRDLAPELARFIV